MNKVKKHILHPELSYEINGVLFKTRKDLGRFRNENQYSDAIEEELRARGIRYEREAVADPSFSGEKQGRNKIDFLIDGKIVLEVKAKSFLTKEDYYQTQRYLSALNLELAIIVNMRKYYVNPKRILNSNARSDDSDTGS
jgi:GxxExxY protein